MAIQPPSPPAGADVLLDTPFRKAGRGIVSKASHVILARELGDLDLVDRKIFNYLLNRVYGEVRLGEATIHRVPVADVLEFLSHSSTDRLHESLSRLGRVEILIDYVDEANVPNSAKAHYLSYNMAMAADGWIHFAFDPILIGFLHNPKIFATLSLAHMRRFRSVYAMKLYEIMALYVNRHFPVWTPTVEEFREQMGIGDAYDRFDNLRKRVVEAAVEEVCAVAPFDVEVECLKSGRGGKVTSLRFTARHKGPETLLDMSLSGTAPTGRLPSPRRDPNTIDLIDGMTDAERSPLGIGAEMVARARAMISAADDGGTVDAYVAAWHEESCGRRIRDPDRHFRVWLEMTLAKKREADLSILEDDTFSTLLEKWEEGAR